MERADQPTPSGPIPGPNFGAASPALSASRDHFRQSLATTLLYSLIGRWWVAIERTIMGVTRRKQAVYFPATVITFNLVVLVVTFALSLFLGETAAVQPFYFLNPALTYFLSRLIWTIFTILYVLIMHAQLLSAVEVVSTTITDNILSTQNLASLQLLIQRVMRIPWHFSFSLAFALIAGAWIPYMLSLYTGLALFVGGVIQHVVNYFQVGMYIYFLLIVIWVLVVLSQLELDVYANDPSNSPVVRSIYQVSSALTLCAAAFVALQFFLMSLSRVDVSAPFALATLVVLGWLPPLVLFITIHLTLAKIITDAKGRKLHQIQQHVRQIEQSHDLHDKESLEKISALMDYHDRIKATPNSMINLDSLSSLFGSLLLPLIATILGSLPTLLDLFN